MSSIKLLEKLSNSFGTPGNEGDVRDIVREELKGLVEFSYDKLGSIICTPKSTSDSPKIMLAGHMDEIGFLVKNITSDGFIKFHNNGGWWSHTLMSQKVTIRTSNGDEVTGIIGSKPVHHLGAAEREKVQPISSMFIDVGAKDNKEVEEIFGISIGDHIAPTTTFSKLANPNKLSGKAFDDRVGVALFIDAIKKLSDSNNNQVIGVGTVQEEVGTRGARTSAHEVNPDIAIILEGPPADDTPGFNKEESSCVIEKGPQIRLVDPSALSNGKFSRFVRDVAKECEIPHQVAVKPSGGTDAREIHLSRSGIPTIVLGVPVRFAHSHVGIMAINDYNNTLKLLVELLGRLDKKTVDSFTDYTTS
jgi:endoglucanase